MIRFLLAALLLVLLPRPAFAQAFQSSNVAGAESGPQWQGFSPTWIVGLKGWWRPDMGVTLNGSAVSAIADSSGTGGGSCTQATPSKQPTFAASDAAYNGFASMAYVSASVQVLVCGNATIPQPFAVFAVGEGSGSSALVGDGASSTDIFLSSSKWSASFGALLQSSNTTTTKQAFISVCNGSSSALYINSSTTTAATGTAGGQTFHSSSALGGNGTVNDFLNGKIAEAAVLNVAPDAYTRWRLLTYANNRYGVASQ